MMPGNHALKAQASLQHRVLDGLRGLMLAGQHEADCLLGAPDPSRASNPPPSTHRSISTVLVGAHRYTLVLPTPSPSTLLRPSFSSAASDSAEGRSPATVSVQPTLLEQDVATRAAGSSTGASAAAVPLTVKATPSDAASVTSAGSSIDFVRGGHVAVAGEESRVPQVQAMVLSLEAPWTSSPEVVALECAARRCTPLLMRAASSADAVGDEAVESFQDNLAAAVAELSPAALNALETRLDTAPLCVAGDDRQLDIGVRSLVSAYAVGPRVEAADRDG